MKKNVLVTLADENFIDQAKQLISSIYWNAGWKGDYLLLAHEIPEEKLKWFRDKGILIKKCKPIFDILGGNWPATVLSKFYLFTKEFKKWDNVVFLDADMIVRASLEGLTKINGFGALGSGAICDAFVNRGGSNALFEEIRKKYPLGGNGIAGGAIAFNTELINETTFSELKLLFERYSPIIENEEPILYLMFNKQRIKISPAYCAFMNSGMGPKIKSGKIDAIALHFAGRNFKGKPWNPENYFHREWKHNLELAELIDLPNVKKPRKIWTDEEIEQYEQCFASMLRSESGLRCIRQIDKSIGKFGLYLKYNFPRIYSFLRE